MADTRLPLVVQLAFAGSRFLFDALKHPAIVASDFEDAVQRELTKRLRQLPTELGLSEHHFVCGLSQLAVGADTVFTRTCKTLNWPQRLLLPQPRENFLAAASPDGTPDFVEDQRRTARELFESPHIIQECVVTEAADRSTRFQDVNLELVRESDVIVCLIQAVAIAKEGGTREVIEHAATRQRPVLEICIDVGKDGLPLFKERWYWNRPTAMPSARSGGFTPPELPIALRDVQYQQRPTVDADEYREIVKRFASDKARSLRTFFSFAALIIVGTHVLATGFALWAFSQHESTFLPRLLAIELSLLSIGLIYHEWLHRSHAVKTWALARLTAEVARSVIPLAGVPRYLRHLFELPMPDSLRPLLRTLNVLHLKGIRTARLDEWETRRMTYIRERLRKPKHGQLDYYRDKHTEASRWLVVARLTFYIGSAGAVLAVSSKLIVVLHLLTISDAAHAEATSTLGFLAVMLPVIAVAALSLAASFDLEARLHTYKEMLDFLNAQTRFMEGAVSQNEFAALALDTETRLLGETAGWYSRRAFVGVT